MFIDQIQRPAVGPYAYAKDFTRHILPDDFHEEIGECVGIRASVTIYIPAGQSTSILQTITSPGLWGIDAESGQGEYGAEVFAEEVATLTGMLASLNVTILN